jgi:transposase-like protein
MAREYSPEVKAQVIAALLAGQSVSATAREYDIPKGTVSAWYSRLAEPTLAGAATGRDPKTSDEIAILLVDLVKAQLLSQIAMAQHCGNPDYLFDQDAHALAMLMGVQNDKLFRLLEALDRARPEPESASN